MIDPAEDTARLHELDGLRGWASFAVLIYHLCYETLGALIPAFRNDVTRALNGTLAVYLFFALSGTALSLPVIAGGQRALASLAVKRYPRLVLPILAATAVTVLLQRLGLTANHAAAAIVHRPDWLGGFLPRPFGLADVLKYSLLFVFTTGDSTQHLVPFLWTMHAEMLGSIFVFALLAVLPVLRHADWLLAGLTLLLLGAQASAFLAAFAAGMLLARLRTGGAVARLRARRGIGLAAAGAMLAALAIVARNPYTDPRLAAAAAIVLLTATQLNRTALRLLRRPVSQLLGRLSFPLYLLHFAVIASLTSALIVRAAAHDALDLPGATGIVAVSVAAALAAAAAFAPVERLTRRLGHRIGAALVAPAPAAAGVPRA